MSGTPILSFYVVVLYEGILSVRENRCPGSFLVCCFQKKHLTVVLLNYLYDM